MLLKKRLLLYLRLRSNRMLLRLLAIVFIGFLYTGALLFNTKSPVSTHTPSHRVYVHGEACPSLCWIEAPTQRHTTGYNRASNFLCMRIVCAVVLFEPKQLYAYDTNNHMAMIELF